MTEARNRITGTLAKLSAHFQDNEKRYFFFAVILNSLPLLLSTFFPTVDGPAHLHNALLLKELLGPNSELVESFFSLNSLVLPNLLDHLILMGGQTLLGGLLAEKTLQLFILIGLPLAIRYCFIKHSLSNRYILYFIFPFTYSFLFFFGFYNFLLSIILLFFGIGFWESRGNMRVSASFIIPFALLLVVSFFTHLMGFALMIGIIGLFEILKTQSRSPKESLRNIALLGLTAIPTLILFLVYFSSKASSVLLSERLSAGEVFGMIKSVQPARGVEFGREGVFTQWVLYSFLLIFIIGLVQIVRKHIKPPSAALRWGLVLGGTTCAAFLIPDSGASSGLVTARLIFLFYLFSIFFLSGFGLPNWLRAFLVFIAIYVTVSLNLIYSEVATKESTIAEAIIEASEQILTGSIVLPLNEDSYWLRGHYSNLLASNKALIILENYEAGLSYFPVQWEKPFPALTLNKADWDNNFAPKIDSTQTYPIEYVFVLGAPENTAIDQFGDLIQVYSNKEASVFLYKTKDP